MRGLLKIYGNVIRYESEAVSMEKRVTEEVIQLSKPYEEQLSSKELEKLQDIMFSPALTTEHEGFQLGAKYFAKLIAQCLS